MILFVFPSYREMGNALGRSLGVRMGRFVLDRFPNQEFHAIVQTDVVDEDCAILGSITPPDEQLLSTLLLSHTLKKEGARTIMALLPYLAYARDDKLEKGKSLATAWVGALLQASGIDEVITVDVHSPAAHHLFPMPLVSLSPAALFGQEIARLSLLDATMVAPDEGASERCQAVARAAGMNEEITVLTKRRTEEGIVHGSISGIVGRQAVIVDDILDTGSTLVSCCRQLRLLGAQDMTILVTHGLFTGEQWQQLWFLGVQRVISTDTLPQRQEHPAEQMRRLSVLPLLCEYLKTRF